METAEMHTLTNLKTTVVSHENNRNAHTHKPENNRSEPWNFWATLASSANINPLKTGDP